MILHNGMSKEKVGIQRNRKKGKNIRNLECFEDKVEREWILFNKIESHTKQVYG